MCIIYIKLKFVATPCKAVEFSFATSSDADKCQGHRRGTYFLQNYKHKGKAVYKQKDLEEYVYYTDKSFCFKDINGVCVFSWGGFWTVRKIIHNYFIGMNFNIVNETHSSNK